MAIKQGNTKKKIWAAAVVAVLVFIGVLYFSLPQKKEEGRQKASPEKEQKSTVSQEGVRVNPDGSVQAPINTAPDIDYENLEKDTQLKSLMEKRKEKLGIQQSLDMIVKSEEKFKVGENKVSMGDILKKAFVKKGEVYQEKIMPSGEVVPQSTKEYGIYVVQPGDNIWNIHFNILKEFYAHRGIRLAAKADEPVDQGRSSGVGKVLKFSEQMVIIYNLAEKDLASNLDLIEPLSKIVVYNMDEVFSLLEQVNYENIDRLQFDGKTLWIPAKTNN